MTEAKKAKSATVAERSFDWLAAGTVIFCLAHFLTALSPGIRTWGIDYWSEFPLWGRSLLLLLVAAVVLPGLPERIARVFEKRVWPRPASWVAAGVVFVIFVALRSQGYSYGDGYSFRSYFVGGGLPSLSGNLVLMSGDLVAHWIFYRVAVMPFDGTVEIAYALISALAGVASLAAISQIARRIFPKDRGARWTVIAAGFSSGMAALWFGHVEAYSLVGAALLWSVAFLIKGRNSWAWGMWIVACGLHLLAVAFLPVLVWAILGRKLIASMTRAKAAILFLIGFVGWGVAGAVFSIAKPEIFVPVVSTEMSVYTAFSMAHLADMANLLLFAAPVGLLGLAAWMARGEPSRSASEDRAISLLAVAAGSLWYFAFWVDPLIGAFRDWDLIGVFGIPLSLLGAVLFLRRILPQGGFRPQWVVLSVFALAHTGAFVMTVQDESKAMERMDRLVREDVHYTREFHHGERLMSWAYILTNDLDKKELAVDHLRNRSIWEPQDRNSWSNLGSLYWKLNRYDSAATCFEEAIRLKGDDPNTFEQLALTYSAMQDWEKARQTVEALAGLRELKILEINLLAFCLLSAGEDRRADSLLTISLSREPDQHEAYYQRGIVYERRSDTAQALGSYERAMQSATDVEDVYLRGARLYQALQRWSDAERVAAAWQAQFPNSALAPFFLGVSRIATQQYPGARDALERSVTLAPNNALTQFYLATAYRNLGRSEAAKEAARRAAYIDSTLALPYLELIYIAADADDRDGAVAATREYLRRAPGDSGMSYLRQFMEP